MKGRWRHRSSSDDTFLKGSFHKRDWIVGSQYESKVIGIFRSHGRDNAVGELQPKRLDVVRRQPAASLEEGGQPAPLDQSDRGLEVGHGDPKGRSGGIVLSVSQAARPLEQLDVIAEQQSALSAGEKLRRLERQHPERRLRLHTGDLWRRKSLCAVLDDAQSRIHEVLDRGPYPEHVRNDDSLQPESPGLRERYAEISGIDVEETRTVLRQADRIINGAAHIARQPDFCSVTSRHHPQSEMQRLSAAGCRHRAQIAQVMGHLLLQVAHPLTTLQVLRTQALDRRSDLLLANVGRAMADRRWPTHFAITPLLEAGRMGKRRNRGNLPRGVLVPTCATPRPPLEAARKHGTPLPASPTFV